MLHLILIIIDYVVNVFLPFLKTYYQLFSIWLTIDWMVLNIIFLLISVDLGMKELINTLLLSENTLIFAFCLNL